MNIRFAAATVAVMSGVAFADARAQNFIPRGPELNYVKPGGSVMPCSTQAIFTSAIRGNPLCANVASGGESQTSGNGLFLDQRGGAYNNRAVALDHRNDSQKGRADDHQRGRGNSRNGHADEHANNRDDLQNAPADQPDELSLALLQAEPAASITVTATPEPGSLVLMATGLLGVAAYRRRRTKTQEGINN